RLDLDGTAVESAVKKAHANLAELLLHEHASLALAQRCSGVAATTPLFSAMLNYRHNAMPRHRDGHAGAHAGIKVVKVKDRANYPLALSVEDYGEALGVTAQVVHPLSADRICGYMHQALESLVEALEKTPSLPVRELEILPVEERDLLLKTWNA